MFPPGFVIMPPATNPNAVVTSRRLALPQELQDAVITKLAVESDMSNEATPHAMRVDFGGVFLFESPAGARHIQYAIQVAKAGESASAANVSTEFMIHRYHEFVTLRNRLICVLTSCQRMCESSWSFHIQPSCEPCKTVLKRLKKIAFPRKTWYFTTLDDVTERSILLPRFMNMCAAMLHDWTGCVRGNVLFARALGEFVGAQLLAKSPSKIAIGAHKQCSQDDDAPTTISSSEDDPTRSALWTFVEDEHRQY